MADDTFFWESAMAADIFDSDGIKYDIVVTKGPAGFLASWTCPKCKVSGKTRGQSATANDASGLARALLFSDHHFSAHVMTRRDFKGTK